MHKLNIAINKDTGNPTHPRDASNSDTYLCPICQHEVFPKKGHIKIHHFAHKSDSNCNFYNNPSESEIHKYAKILLSICLRNKIPLHIIKNCNKCTENIIYVTDFKIETEWAFQYNGQKYADIAYISENNIKYIFEICHTNKTNEENRPEPWFEFKAVDVIDAFNSRKAGEKLQLNCIRTCKTCYRLHISNHKGQIYVNQRGAGCGKTFESIQLIANDEKFRNKDTFIYLTKIHAAKEVIYNEFKSQHSKGLLTTIEDPQELPSGNQYKIKFKNISTNKSGKIIIGTIDSFTYAIANHGAIDNNGVNWFINILNCIRQGQIKNGNISYARDTVLINEQCLIVIDEAQDLGLEYFEAFNRILDMSNIDIYIIGDKLQSIWTSHNLFTSLDDYKCENVIKNIGRNKVKRFHNERFIEFVNKIIPFEKYQLPEISGICERNNCEFKHENDKDPYTVFELEQIYSNDYNYEKIDRNIDTIIEYMELEINRYNYLPQNFTFIFPILSKNPFATQLENRLQQFWIDKFKNSEYQRDVLSNNEYWKDTLDKQEFYKYVYLHKSDEGKSINLKESEHATRILSIHASKGQGCEVVFVLGLSESSLKVFSNETGNIIYDSLLHVAMTRQKKSLYFGIVHNNDDIHRKFKEYSKSNNNIEPDLNFIKKHNQYCKIKNEFLSTDEFTKFLNNIYPEEYDKNVDQNRLDDKNIIDMGHHMIRYATMFYMVMAYIKLEDPKDVFNKDQFITILRKISNIKIVKESYHEYNESLRQIDKSIKKKYDIDKIPILLFDKNKRSKYYTYASLLCEFINNIQYKINCTMSLKCEKYEMPRLCSLESIILVYLIEIYTKGSYANYSMKQIYDIIYCFDSVSKQDHSHEYRCLCYKFDEWKYTNREKYSDIEVSIRNHYECTHHLHRLYYDYKTKLQSLNITSVKYNINHKIYFGNNNDHISINNIFNIIGHSDEYIINIILKPQLNNLNIKETIYNMILDTYFLLNTSPESENFKRFNNKKIMMVIITLDHKQPLYFEFNIEENHKNIIKNYLQEYLYNTYSSYHEDIFKFYEHCKKNRPEGVSGLRYTIENFKKYKQLPKYISDYFTEIDEEILQNKSKTVEIVNEKLGTKEKFIEHMNAKLDYCIKTYLSIKDLVTEVEIDY